MWGGRIASGVPQSEGGVEENIHQPFGRGMRTAIDVIRVLLCEDDPRVRLTLTRAVESQRDLEVVGAVGTGEEALVAAVDPGADVLVLDVHLPGIDGIEVIRRLRDDGIELPVLVLSADDRAAERLDGLDRVSFLSKGTSGALAVLHEIRAKIGPAP
jgi:DNA-binding NarL/FixJ family response regulator